MTSVLPESETVAAESHDDWGTLYDTYSVRVWRYVASIIGSDSNAVGDAVQETFLAAARAFDQFDASRGTVWAWLTGIAHREVAAHWRRIRRQRLQAGQVEQAADEGEQRSRLEQAETVEIVRRILAEMSPDSVAILTGKYCEELSVAELVEQLGGTTEGIRSKLARARREFRQRLEREAPGAVPWSPLREMSSDQT